MIEEKSYKDRKFMFFYLNSGNGHIAQASVLKQAMEEECPGIDVRLLNGFADNNYFSKFWFETFYSFSCNYLHGAYPLVYDITQPQTMLALVKTGIAVTTRRYLEKTIIKNGITDIVSFHFGLSPSLSNIVFKLKKKGININLTVFNTDPFTCHNAWFYKYSYREFVGSDDVRNYAIQKMHCIPSRIIKVPLLVDKRFKQKVTDDEKKSLRRKYGFDENKKVVLLAGGGEGLPGTRKIINHCILHKTEFTVAVVCGRNKRLQKDLELIKKTFPELDLHVFGFVDFMDSLIKLSDLVVSKAGTSSILEILSSGKPLIISSYIHNQELGNMRFVVQNKVGFFIRNPSDIFRKIHELFSDEEKYMNLVKRFDTLDIDTDASKIVKLLVYNTNKI